MRHTYRETEAETDQRRRREESKAGRQGLLDVIIVIAALHE